MNYVFAWDPKKARLNLEKHGISFEEAVFIFVDPDALDWVDATHSKDELRFKRLGSVAKRILIAVYVIRKIGDGQKEIRIISARQASRKERQAYAGC